MLFLLLTGVSLKTTTNQPWPLSLLPTEQNYVANWLVAVALMDAIILFLHSAYFLHSMYLFAFMA